MTPNEIYWIIKLDNIYGLLVVDLSIGKDSKGNPVFLYAYKNEDGSIIKTESKSLAMMKYRELEGKLWKIRCKREGEEKEDPILEEMAAVWWVLTAEERDLLNSERLNCWPEKG